MILVNITLSQLHRTNIEFMHFPSGLTGLSVVFEQEAYSISESKPANICAMIVNGIVERPQPVSLTLTTSPGTASCKELHNTSLFAIFIARVCIISTAFEDYVPTRPVIEFETNGATTVCVNIPTVADSVIEDTEEYFVLLEPAAEVEELAPSNTTVYIIDEDGKSLKCIDVGIASSHINEMEIHNCYVIIQEPK